LHDIGKLAIDEVMPKSFTKIVSEAKARGVSMYEVEQAHLGLDHTIVGKRLAEKWHLPEEVTTAIWLHHSNIEAIADELPSGAIARVVHLADIIARQCQIGDSGSFDVPVLPDGPSEVLAIPAEKVQEIKDALRTEVSQKAEALGLTAPGGPAAYCEMVQETAVNLARDNSRLSTTNQTLATNAGSMDLVSGLLLETGSNTPTIDVAANAAVNWKKHYQTGAVCIYLQNPSDDGLLEVAIAGDAVEPVKLLLDRPDEPALMPSQSRDGFAVVDAGEQGEWLARNAGLKCDVSRMKLAPLI